MGADSCNDEEEEPEEVEEEPEEETAEEKRESELEKALDLKQAIEAIQQALLHHYNPEHELVLDQCIQKLKEVRENLRVPVLWCSLCGYEWDGRAAPTKGEGCDHSPMWELWADVERTGVSRGANESVDDFLERLKGTMYGILPSSGRARS